MKKALLILSILIILLGFGLGSWYFITNQSTQKGINIKLRATGYFLEWNSSITENEKEAYMWGFTDEQEFIQTFAIEMGAYDMLNNTLEIKDDLTAKLYTDGSNENLSLYYILAKNNTRILFFEDKNLTQRFTNKQALSTGITIKNDKYLHEHFTEYHNDMIVFTFYVEYEQVI